MSKRAAIYARTSYDDRSSDAQNIQGQLVMGREYAAKKGYEIVGEFAEDEKGASGAKINLPQLNKLREMAQSHLFDVLIVREVDRLSRDVGKFSIISKELARNQVSIEFVLYDFPNSPSGRLAKNQLSAIAEYIRDDIREKTMGGRFHTVKNNYVIVAATAPYGYRKFREVVNGKDTHLKLEVFPDEADIIKEIYKWYAVDCLSLREIVRRLDIMGAPKPLSGGKPRSKGWARSTVFKILRSKTYMGEWTYHYDKNNNTYYGKQTISVEVPAIIEPSLWKTARLILDRNKERNARATRYEYLFSRRLTCGKCGRFMACEPQQKLGKLYNYYVCPGPENNRRNNCPGMRVRVNLVDEIAWNWITEILKDPVRLQSEIEVYQNRLHSQQLPLIERIENFDKLLVENRGKLERLIDLYMSGVFQLEQLKERKSELEKRINDLESQRNKLSTSIESQPLKQDQVDELQAFAKEISTKFDKATFEQKRQLIEMLKVEGLLSCEDGNKVLSLRCSLRVEQNKLLINNMTS
jgi:site-specific DNA recombinase